MKLKQDNINASLMLDIWQYSHANPPWFYWQEQKVPKRSRVFVGLSYCRINLFVVTATSGPKPKTKNGVLKICKMTSVVDSRSGRVFCLNRNCILKMKCLSFKGSLEDYVNLEFF